MTKIEDSQPYMITQFIKKQLPHYSKNIKESKINLKKKQIKKGNEIFCPFSNKMRSSVTKVLEYFQDQCENPRKSN